MEVMDGFLAGEKDEDPDGAFNKQHGRLIIIFQWFHRVYRFESMIACCLLDQVLLLSRSGTSTSGLQVNTTLASQRQVLRHAKRWQRWKTHNA